MFQIKLVDHVFTIYNRYSYVETICQDYKTTAPSGIPISVTDAEIAEMAAKMKKNIGTYSSPAYLEGLIVYTKIAKALLADKIMLFHASALAVDGRAYLFTGPSGAGKSTHAGLWRAHFGDRAVTINDDKPLLSFTDTGIWVHGTPYAGKEGLQTNASAPVAGIVVIHQASENAIRPLTPKEAYPILLSQAYRESTPEVILPTMELVKRLTAIPVFALDCTISNEAVMLAYETLTQM